MKKVTSFTFIYSITSIMVLIVIVAFLIGNNNFIVELIREINISIRDIRNLFFSSFSTKIDDFLQFIPALLMLTLKFCGYKGNMDNKTFTLFICIATLITQITIYALKINVGELRPDASDTLSFPSGHTATAFMIATMITLEYNGRSMIYGIFGFSSATAVALMRILNNRHWLFDTIIGAALGILLTYWAYRVTKSILRLRAKAII